MKVPPKKTGIKHMKNSYFLLAALALTLSCTRTEKDSTRRVRFERAKLIVAE